MPEVFIGRQPIFDRNLQVYAYELLFRSGDRTQAGVVDGDQATSQVIINAFMEIGLNQIVGSHRAFLNFTRDFLMSDAPLPLPKDRVVLEVLEDVRIDTALVDAVRSLRKQGFTIALDDFVFAEEWRPLVEIAEIIKIDVMALDRDEIRAHVDLLRGFDVTLLAEKIESVEDLDYLQSLGFDFFQGYFLSKPTIVKGRRIPANHLATLQLLARLNDPEVNVGALDKLISRDINLSYKLLRYINSAFFALPRKVESIRQAVVYLGLREIKTWASLLAMSGIQDKPYELFNLSLIRAKMCELLAQATEQPNTETFFTVGLFSILDALMDLPMDAILDALPLSEPVSNALTRQEGRLGEALRCAIAYERWDWDKICYSSLDADTLQAIYFESLAWTMRANANL